MSTVAEAPFFRHRVLDNGSCDLKPRTKRVHNPAQGDISTAQSIPSGMPKIATLDGQTVTVQPYHGTVLLRVGEHEVLLDATSLPARDTQRHLRTCFEAAAEEAEDAAIEAYEYELAGYDVLDRLSHALAWAEARSQGAARTCPNGHALTEENTFSSIDGSKGCRECRRARNNWTTEGGQLKPKPVHERADREWRFRP